MEQKSPFNFPPPKCPTLKDVDSTSEWIIHSPLPNGDFNPSICVFPGCVFRRLPDTFSEIIHTQRRGRWVVIGLGPDITICRNSTTSSIYRDQRNMEERENTYKKTSLRSMSIHTVGNLEGGTQRPSGVLVPVEMWYWYTAMEVSSTLICVLPSTKIKEGPDARSMSRTMLSVTKGLLTSEFDANWAGLCMWQHGKWEMR